MAQHVGLITGTKVMTMEGEVPVEALRVGARALTLASTDRPIQPLAAIAVGPVPAAAGPILVRAGTVAEGVPIRDLVVAPDQALVMREDADDAIKLDFSKRRLIPVRDLANGATVTRIRAPRGARYHRPIVAGADLLMADGICVGAAAPAADPALPMLEWSAAQPYRERLLARARAAGWSDTDDPDLAVEVGGIRLAPLASNGQQLAVRLPAGTTEVTITSRISVPDEFAPGSGDTRRLGVALAEIALEGVTIRLDTDWIIAGALAPEAEGKNTWRWTDGAAVLKLPPDAGERRLELRIHWGWRTYRAPPGAHAGPRP
ncbi:MAG: Hint domain-containing protein [Rhodospirillales bacterium]|nr:Hint domain-containing protein [Rhodospirillales bacterium]